MHILFISWWWPYPANNGSKIRIYNLLQHLSREFRVTLLSFADVGEATPEQLAHMRSFCNRVEVVAKPIYKPGTLKATLGYFSRWPRSLVDVYSEQMESLVKQVCTDDDVQMIVASQLQTMRYLELVPHISGILEEIEITYFLDRVHEATSRASHLRSQMTLSKFENSLRQLLERGIAFTVVSEDEKRNMQRFAPAGADIRVIPNGVDTLANRPDAAITVDPHRLIYSGAVTFQPNYEAVRYFITEVLPLVRANNPQMQFYVTGGTEKIDVSDLAAQAGVTFTGYLTSVADAVRSSLAMVVALQAGGGTRLKILEAMSLGTPVISTRKGAEGLDVHDGHDILIADSPQEMANAIQRLSTDAGLQAQLAVNARQLVEENYDWGIIAQQLYTLIHDISHQNIPLKEKQ